MRISGWSSDVCSSDLIGRLYRPKTRAQLSLFWFAPGQEAGEHAPARRVSPCGAASGGVMTARSCKRGLCTDISGRVWGIGLERFGEVGSRACGMGRLDSVRGGARPGDGEPSAARSEEHPSEL